MEAIRPKKRRAKPVPVPPSAQLKDGVFVLTLPYPTRAQINALGPNGRTHWRTKHRENRNMLELAHTLTTLAMPHGTKAWDTATITFRFYWPNNIRRDVKNFEAIYKGAIDGIVKAGLVVDDSWRYLRAGPESVCEVDKVRPRIEIVIEAKEQA